MPVAGPGRDACPPRPLVPGLLYGAGATCLSCAMGSELSWRSVEAVPGAPSHGGLAIALALVAVTLLLLAVHLRAGMWFERWGSVPAIVSACAAAGLIASAAWSCEMAASSVFCRGISVEEVVVVIEGDPYVGGTGWSHRGRIVDGRTKRSARITVSSSEPLVPGSSYRCRGRISVFDEGSYARSRYLAGYPVELKVSSSTPGPRRRDPIAWFRNRMLAAIRPEDSDARALTAGVVCGRTTELKGTRAEADFSRAGLTHLIAVSGSHLACIAGIIGVVLDRFGAPGAVRSAVLVGAMACYVVFTGGAPSAVRSAIMVACTQVARLARRRPHAISGLAIAIISICLVRPGVVFDLGFQLSAASVLFIGLFFGYLSSSFEACGAPRWLSEPAAMSTAAQWATLPLTVPVFRSISLVSLPANIIVGPLMSALMALGLLAVPCAALVPCLSWMLAPLDWMASCSIFAAHVLASFPFSSVLASWGPLLAMLPYAGAVALYIAWPDPRPGPLLCGASIGACICACPLIFWMFAAPPSVCVLDIGQGDSILLRGGSHAVLVDAGVDEATRDALARNHVYQLDALIVTHWDLDHYGGLESFAGEVQIDRIIVARGAAAGAPEEVAGTGIPIVEVDAGDLIEFGVFTCEVVWPREVVGGGENADSLCLKVGCETSGGAFEMLLTGDAERDELARFAREIGPIDVLKLGHHGSARAVDEMTLGVLDPVCALASAGEGNSYGHPSKECRECVEESGAIFISTIEGGDIVVEPCGGSFSVRTRRRGR